MRNCEFSSSKTGISEIHAQGDKNNYPGIKTYKCRVCGYVIKTEEIAKLLADEEPINKKISVATKVTKAQKMKNEIIIIKKFHLS